MKKSLPLLLLIIFAIIAIVLAFVFPSMGDKFFLTLTSAVSVYVGFLAFQVSSANARRAEKNELESISAHLRVVNVIREETTLQLKIQNGGGTMVKPGMGDNPV